MDRIALSKRLEGLSSVFADSTPYRRELLAMSVALTKMAEDKFSTILEAGYEADGGAFDSPGRYVSPGVEDARARALGRSPQTKGNVVNPEGFANRWEQQFGSKSKELQEFGKKHNLSPNAIQEISVIISKDKAKGAPMPNILTPQQQAEGAPMPNILTNKQQAEGAREASEAGMYWNKDASEAVLNNLLRDVCGMDKAICCDTGRKLEKEQVPEGVHAGIPEKAATLKPEQTPSIKEVLNSNMVAESKKTPLKKEATEETEVRPTKTDETDETEETAEKPAVKKVPKSEQVKAEKSEEKAEDLKEQAKKDTQKATKKLEEAEKAEKAKDASFTFDFDGIELTAGMEEVELTADEAEKLAKLF